MNTVSNPIRALLFDLGNVLFRFDHMRVARAVTEGTSVQPEALFKLVFDSPIVVEHDTGKISTEQFYGTLKNELQLSLPYDRFLKIWNDIFTEDQQMTQLVEQLAERYPLYLISNTNRPHFEFLKARCPALARFRGVILSYEVGHLKPHPAIYQKALEEARLPASEILYIDDREDLIAAGQALGFQTHRFTDFAELQADLGTRQILESQDQ